MSTSIDTVHRPRDLGPVPHPAGEPARGLPSSSARRPWPSAPSPCPTRSPSGAAPTSSARSPRSTPPSRRIDAGTYGTCAGCGATIPEERLELRPFTATCVGLQLSTPGVRHSCALDVEPAIAAPGRTRAPRRVAVVGAGMVGLATAWFLQEGGVQVTVYERDQVGAGASWGNAGWLTPALTAPLPEPAVLRYGLRAVLSPRSPVYLPLRADPHPAALPRLASCGTAPRGSGAAAMAAYVPLNERALEAFDVLAAGGVTAPTHRAEPFLACYRPSADAGGLLDRAASRSATPASGTSCSTRSPAAGAGPGPGAHRPRSAPPCRSTASATCTRRSTCAPWRSPCAPAAARSSRAST